MAEIDPQRRALMAGGIAAFGGAALAGPAAAATLTAQEHRPVDIMTRLGGDGAAASRATVAAFSPDLATMLDTQLNAVAGRPGLSLKSRELVTSAALIVLGSVPEALKFHLGGMLRTGWTPEQVVELVLNAIIYGGLPPAQAAMLNARDVFKEMDVPFRAASGRPQGDDWQQGVAQLSATGGRNALSVVERALSREGIAPALDRWTVEFGHGEILSRPTLTTKDRALATLAMAVTAGNMADALTFHANACRRVGWTGDEVKETMLHLTLYAGWPKVLAAIGSVGAALDQPVPERAPDGTALAARSMQAGSDDANYRRGVETMAQVSRASGEAVVNGFKDIAPDLGRYILEFAYGEVFSRPGLDLKSRELATVAALAVRGSVADATPLKVHVAGALNTGATRTEIVEAVLHMLPYAGFIRVQQAIALVGEAFAEQEKA